ncbi:histidine kinase [Niabella sp. CC-SYL272]|uniref:sensor histidine kinase n=1 Tax=Niabella agricola TaxID=2891571 RepID=UPI001F19F19A|nr:histidine kinase [Niabella agricola]MCF3110707.1 histidine kinase [Niabella agricola]
MATPYTELAQDRGSNLWLRFFMSPRWRVFRHLLCIFLIGLLVVKGKNEEYNLTGEIIMKVVLLVWLTGLPYLNMYYFVPRFLFRRRYFSYFLLVLLTATACFFLIFEGGRLLIAPYRVLPPKNETITLDMVFSFLFALCVLLAASTSIKLLQRWIEDSYRFRQIEVARLQSELNQLKSQVNPHFLFNTLNNTHILIQKDPVLAATVVLKLSDLLRYQLYDSSRPAVLLAAEIRFLHDFLELEQLRRDQFEFSISTRQLPENRMVPPFLFISFVENAVKHSSDPTGRSQVHVFFEATGALLHFSCKNSRPLMPDAHRKEGGLGLANAIRRLELLYQGRHNLQINEAPDHYQVVLTLPL